MHRLDQIGAKKPAKLLYSKSLTLDFSRQQIWPVFLPFPSIGSLVATERACVWTLGGLLDDAEFDRLLKQAKESLRPFVTADGGVVFTMPALIVTAAKT